MIPRLQSLETITIDINQYSGWVSPIPDVSHLTRLRTVTFNWFEDSTNILCDHLRYLEKLKQDQLKAPATCEFIGKHVVRRLPALATLTCPIAVLPFLDGLTTLKELQLSTARIFRTPTVAGISNTGIALPNLETLNFSGPDSFSVTDAAQYGVNISRMPALKKVNFCAVNLGTLSDTESAVFDAIHTIVANTHQAIESIVVPGGPLLRDRIVSMAVKGLSEIDPRIGKVFATCGLGADRGVYRVTSLCHVLLNQENYDKLKQITLSPHYDPIQLVLMETSSPGTSLLHQAIQLRRAQSDYPGVAQMDSLVGAWLERLREFYSWSPSSPPFAHGVASSVDPALLNKFAALGRKAEVEFVINGLGVHPRQTHDIAPTDDDDPLGYANAIEFAFAAIEHRMPGAVDTAGSLFCLYFGSK
jgi:hypothetical protein